MRTSCLNPITRCLPLWASLLLAACGGGGAEDTTATAGAAGMSIGGSTGGGKAPATLPPLRIPSGQETVTCRDASIGAIALDTVFVPDNAVCELFGTRLKGSVQVGRNATLFAADVAVNGNLQGEGSALVTVAGASTVGGSVQLKQGGAATLQDLRVGGDLQLDTMAGSLFVQGSRLGGSLQAMGNRGGLTLLDNTMDGNLQCKDNLPPPQGSGNSATQKEDQCVGL